MNWLLTNFSSIGNCKPQNKHSSLSIGPFGALTEDLLQLHDAGIGPNAMDGLRVLEVGAFLENLAVGAIGIMLVGHVALLVL